MGDPRRPGQRPGDPRGGPPSSSGAPAPTADARVRPQAAGEPPAAAAAAGAPPAIGRAGPAVGMPGGASLNPRAAGPLMSAGGPSGDLRGLRGSRPNGAAAGPEPARPAISAAAAVGSRPRDAGEAGPSSHGPAVPHRGPRKRQRPIEATQPAPPPPVPAWAAGEPPRPGSPSRPAGVNAPLPSGGGLDPWAAAAAAAHAPGPAAYTPLWMPPTARPNRALRLENLLSKGKLLLILDLDHTLLNTVRASEVETDWEPQLHAALAADVAAAAAGAPRSLFHLPQMGLWTKLRPNVHRFLRKATELYELHAMTFGNPQYAALMMELLDPGGALFGTRVVAMGGSLDGATPAAKDLNGLEGLEGASLIVDDSERVWPEHRANLIVPERYHYFPASRQQFGLSGPAYLERSADESESSGVLASILTVLTQVHYVVFADVSRMWVTAASGGPAGGAPPAVDVRTALTSVRCKVLAGLTILFSRVIPLGQPQASHALWRLATELGAKCVSGIDPSVTHVITNTRGTDKVAWAEANGKAVVHTDWLEACGLLWRRAREADYVLPSERSERPAGGAREGGKRTPEQGGARTPEYQPAAPPPP